MRLLFRLVSLLIFGAAFAALVVDGTRSVAAGRVTLLPLTTALDRIAPGETERLHEKVVAAAPALWDAVAAVMSLPTWAVLGVVAIVLYLLTQRRSPKIGYTRR